MVAILSFKVGTIISYSNVYVEAELVITLLYCILSTLSKNKIVVSLFLFFVTHTCCITVHFFFPMFDNKKELQSLLLKNKNKRINNHFTPILKTSRNEVTA